MGLKFLLALLAVSTVSLLLSAVFLSTAGHDGTLPFFIVWLTISIATTYVLLCQVIISLLRKGSPQRSRPTISRPLGEAEQHQSPLPDHQPPAHDSMSTFYYCTPNLAGNTMPRDDSDAATVVHDGEQPHGVTFPPRAASLPRIPSSMVDASTGDLRLSTSSRIVEEMPAVDIATPPAAKLKEAPGEVLRGDSVSKLRDSTAERVQAPKPELIAMNGDELDSQEVEKAH